MQVGARELRIRTANILQKVRRGEVVTITYRKTPVAVITPLKTAKRVDRKFEPIGFGMWAGRRDLADVSGWVRKIRRARYLR